MNGMHRIKLFLLSVTAFIFFSTVLVSSFALTISQLPPPKKQTSQEVKPIPGATEGAIANLNLKVDLLETINKKLMESVYWTLATLAAIFLGLISANLYFNVTANRREIEKIKDDAERATKSLIAEAETEILRKSESGVQAETLRIKGEIENLTTSLVKTAEASVLQRSDENVAKEIKLAISNFENVVKNMLLTQESKLLAEYEKADKKVESAIRAAQLTSGKLKDLEINVREVEVFMYSQKGKMGGIYGQVDLLEHDLKNREWNLRYRLPEIRDELKTTGIPENLATRLRENLATIKDDEHQAIIGEIEKAITISKRSP
jgi:hypothetical protein